MKKLLLILTLMPATVQAQLVGPGLNTHAKQLPVAALQAIGIRWVRADLPIGTTTQSNAKWIVDHYKPLPVLWMLDNREPDPIKTANDLYRAGVRHVEIANEPDGAWFKQMTPENVADRFVRIWESLPTTVSLYGPSTSKWLPEYTNHYSQRLRSKLGEDWRDAAAGISVHLYWSKVDDLPGLVFESQRRWGVPLVCTEVSSADVNWQDYPEKLQGANLFLAIQTKLGLIPWCWYDGPENYPCDPRGLFRWTGKEWQPTATYTAILTGIAPGAPNSFGPEPKARAWANLRSIDVMPCPDPN